MDHLDHPKCQISRRTILVSRGQILLVSIKVSTKGHRYVGSTENIIAKLFRHKILEIQHEAALYDILTSLTIALC